MKLKKVILAWMVTLTVLSVTGCDKKGDTAYVPSESLQPFEGTEVNVYYTDDNAEYILAHTAVVAEVTGDVLVQKLIQYGMLNPDVQLLSMEEKQQKGKKILYLDFNQAFQTQISSLGSAGEHSVMGSVVNTFLDAFDTDKVMITVEGKTLESGNQIYDEPEKKYAATEDTYEDHTIQKNGKEKTIETKRACIRMGFAFFYDNKQFRFSEDSRKNTFVLESKKKKKDGTPVISMTGEPCANSIESEVISMMEHKKDGWYESSDSIYMGKDQKIFSGRVQGNPKNKKYNKIYYIMCKGNMNPSEVGTYKLTISGYENSLMDNLQVALDTMEFVGKEE